MSDTLTVILLGSVGVRGWPGCSVTSVGSTVTSVVTAGVSVMIGSFASPSNLVAILSYIYYVFRISFLFC